MKCFRRFDICFQWHHSSSSLPITHRFPANMRSSQTYISFPKNINETSWFLDATHYMANQNTSFIDKSEYIGSNKLLSGDGSSLPITHVTNFTLILLVVV